MGILTKEVEVIPSGRSVKYYRDLGYDVKCRKPLIVKVEDLPDGSNVKIQYLCDYCKKEVITIVYADLVRRTKEVKKMACKHCYPQKIKETSLLRFGETSYTKTQECQEKRKNTVYDKYGVEHYSQTQEYKDKWNETCTERYGSSYRKQFINKAFDTFYNKTGYRFPSQSPDVKLKLVKAFYENGTVPTSKQQLYIFNVYKDINQSIELNFPVSYYNVDICFLEWKFVVEYDGGFHDGIVQTGKLTRAEFDKKEIIRNNAIKREGYKIIRIISKNDFLPNDNVLLKMFFDARDYFQKTSHTWQTYDIDKSLLFNTENPQGTLYSFGSLRTVKDSDLQTFASAV